MKEATEYNAEYMGHFSLFFMHTHPLQSVIVGLLPFYAFYCKEAEIIRSLCING